MADVKKKPQLHEIIAVSKDLKRKGIELSYPIEVFFSEGFLGIDEKIESFAKKYGGEQVASGAGFGKRDITLEFNNNAQQFKTEVIKKFKKYGVKIQK